MEPFQGVPELERVEGGVPLVAGQLSVAGRVCVFRQDAQNTYPAVSERNLDFFERVLDRKAGPGGPPAC